ncbi:MAG: hypothetical protein GF317_02510 [Candidatus Lokiarchaeota archaeon]|nr:hypothetical protein [Candidatus Lokiarchaeota archaeon]MBD3198779.1 hypothetical protein [Candidatus Lokiarchaeota archaeon]
MIRIRSPGRICLFGEHQDYLGYPTISMAISRFIFLKAKRIDENKFKIILPDMNQEILIDNLGKEKQYRNNRDYLISGFNQFLRSGISFNKGYEISINGNIPINAGAASSSALVVAWLYFLNLISGRPFSKYKLTLLAYETEVGEFGEAGGMMDFFNSIFGNLIYLENQGDYPEYIKWNLDLERFVLVDSRQKKSTVEDLKNIKSTSLTAFQALNDIMDNFNKYSTKLDDIKGYLPSLKNEYQEKIIGNLINRDLTKKAYSLFIKYGPILTQAKNINDINFFYETLGELLNQHHLQLKNNIRITTEKIDHMIDKSIQKGAIAGKINGSGFGGTFFILTNDNKDILIKNFSNLNLKAYSINTSGGVQLF